MPRHKPKLPTLRRHATGQAYVRIGQRNVYLGVHGSPGCDAAYQRFLAAYLLHGRELPERTPPAPPARTVNQRITRYLLRIEQRKTADAQAETTRAALAGWAVEQGLPAPPPD